MTPMRTISAAMALVAMSLGARLLPAQSLAQRLASASDGTVRLSFAARPGVCGNGRSISTTRESDEWESDCDAGPVRVALSVRDGRATAVRTYVGGRWRPATDRTTDWGLVPARAAADLLLALAAGENAASQKAIFPATLADSVEVWPRLIALARNTAVRREARKQAVFWLGQAAGAAATRGLDSLMQDAGLERPIQEQVVFALSQRPNGEGIPVLIRVARTHPDPAVRRKAMFWLGQSDDPRALALFEDLLTGR